eukprot:gene3667-3928_t
MRWLQAYASDTAALVDDSMMGYFSYIARKHSWSVLACVLFFAMAHPQEFRGATPKLLLQAADHPVKVLNDRLSFYRDLFGATLNGVPKAEALAALIVRRPDIAAWFSHNLVVRLFDAEVAVGPVLEVLAGLALLPDCWHEVVDGQPQVWLNSFVSAVLQDASNANRMVLHLEKKLLTVTALTGGSRCQQPGLLFRKRRPDVWKSISREDKEIIRTELSEEEQLQMLAMLLELPESSIKAAAHPRQLMTRVIQKHKRLITQQIHPALQALLVVQALQETEYEEGWAQKVNFPTRWLMGIMNRVLRDNKE